MSEIKVANPQMVAPVPDTAQKGGASRRRVPRRAYKRKIGVLYKGEYRVGQTIEVGEGGCRLQTTFEFNWQDFVVVTFAMPGEPLVSLRAEVRYLLKTTEQLGHHYGVEFKNIDYKVKRKIRNYVAAKTEKESLEAQQTEADRKSASSGN